MTLRDTFGAEWEGLSAREKRLLFADFKEMLLEEYDTPDPTMDFWIERENTQTALVVYAKRIGEGNLVAYVASLVAGVAK